MDIFGSSGVRGVALESLTPDFALEIAQAAGTVFRQNHDRVAVGRDTRTTGQLLVDAAASGLASVGCNVDRVGIVPTPSLQAYCEQQGIPGLMVTASHNPPEFNGIKLIGSRGVELTEETLERVERHLIDGVSCVAWDEAGHSQTVDGVNRSYLEQLLASADRERIEDAQLTVALDPGHGAGVFTSPAYFRALGCEVVTVNAQADGRFPGRDPEPVEEHMRDLERLVSASEADLGIAHDGDGDRAMFVDENGEFVSGDAVLAALTADELREGDMIVSAVNSSQRLVDVAHQQKAGLHLTPIGSTYIITAIQKLREQGNRVAIAGEGNGGIIFPEYRIARDGAYTATRLCELIADSTVSTVVDDYGGYHSVQANLSYDTQDEREAMIDAIEQYAEAADVDADTIDGYRLDYGDAWVLARPSGTEPVIRVYAEAREESRASELLDGMVDAIEQV